MAALERLKPKKKKKNKEKESKQVFLTGTSTIMRLSTHLYKVNIKVQSATFEVIKNNQIC